MNIFSVFGNTGLLFRRVGVAGLAAFASTGAMAGTAVFVDLGQPLEVIEAGKPWGMGTEYILGSGIGNALVAGAFLEDGDVRVSARLALSRLETTAAAFVINEENFFGFDGGQKNFYVEGPMFGNRTTLLGKAELFIAVDKPFDFVVERSAGVLRFFVNDREIYTTEDTREKFGRIAFRPHHGTMRIYDWRATGKFKWPLPQDDLLLSGDGSYHTYRVPSAVATESGAVLFFCEGRKRNEGDSGDIDILMKKSLDGGKTWSAKQVIFDEGANTVGNPCPVVDRKTGRVWLFCCWNWGTREHRYVKNGYGKDSRLVYVMYSDDDGETWSKPEDITKAVKRKDWSGYFTGPGAGIQTVGGRHPGRLIVPASHRREGDQRAWSHVIYSDDNGASWKAGGAVGEMNAECEVAELADGRLLLNMRNTGPEPSRVFAYSSDAGKTWSRRLLGTSVVDARCPASLRRYSLASDEGSDGKNRLLFANANSPKRENLTVHLSLDEGRTWAASRSLHPGPSADSCLVVLPDRQILCLYEGGFEHPYERIRIAHFDLNWLTQTDGGLPEAADVSGSDDASDSGENSEEE